MHFIWISDEFFSILPSSFHPFSENILSREDNNIARYCHVGVMKVVTSLLEVYQIEIYLGTGR